MSTPTPASPPDPDSQPAHPPPSPQPLQPLQPHQPLAPPPPPPPPPPAPAPYPPASGYPPGGYPGYPGYPGYLVLPPPVRNGMAVTSMVVSIIAAATLLCSLCVYLFGLVSLAGGGVGLVLGIIARKQISARGESGAGMALTGIIVGAISAGIGLLLIVVGLLFLGLGFFAFLMESDGVTTNP